MPEMRAKLRVTNVEVFSEPDGPTRQENLTFNAVAASQYPADGSDENNTFAKWSPNAEFKISVMNPALFGKFERGQTYYVDFIRAPD